MGKLTTLLALLALPFIGLAQGFPRYQWVQIGGRNYVRITETVAPAGQDSTLQTRFVRYTDTASMRTVLTQQWAEANAQNEELTALASRAAAKRDSIYKVLQDLNDGYGSTNDAPPHRAPLDPNTDCPQRWGAILPKNQILIG